MCCVIVSCCFQNSVSWKSVFLWVGYLGVCAFWLFVEPFIYFAKFSTSTSSDTLSALSSPTTHLHDVLQAFGFCSLSFNLLLSCSSIQKISHCLLTHLEQETLYMSLSLLAHLIDVFCFVYLQAFYSFESVTPLPLYFHNVMCKCCRVKTKLFR